MKPSVEIENEIVLNETSARLVPPDNRYPDCICKLVLTEQGFYALENNFDGSFLRHVQIPFQRLLSMEEYVGESALDRKNSGLAERGKTGGASGEPAGLTETMAGLFGGWLAFFQARRRGGETPRLKKFLQVKYDGGGQYPESVFFESCAGISGMIQAFRAHTQRQVYRD